MKTLVIGYGNTLRGDDGLGVRLAERLGGITCHQLTPELALEIAHADRIVLADARSGLAGEDVQCRVLEPELGRLGSGFHRLRPEELLGLATELRRRPQEAYLITIPGSDFRHGEGLSLQAVEALDRATEVAESLLSAKKGGPHSNG